MDIEYKHEMTVDANSWFIRLYVWMWEAKRSDINFCKLFWGYFPVFFLLNLVVFQLMIRPVIWLVGELLDLLPERERPTELQKSIKLREERLVKQEKARLKDDRGPSLPQRFLSGVGAGASLLIMRISQFWGWVTSHKTVNFVVLRATLGIAILLSAGAIAGIIYLAVVNFGVTAIILAVIAGAIIAVLFIVALHYLGVLAKMANVSSAGWKKTKEGSKGFWEVMVDGFIAVKSNTCPKINLSDEERRAA
jgi:hypothetical protein